MCTEIRPTETPDELDLDEQLTASSDWGAEEALTAPPNAGEIVVLSAAGADAPVAWRERLAVHADSEGAAAAQLPGAGTIVEAMVLSTCERFEVYAVASDAERAERELVRWVAQRSDCPPATVATRVRTFRGRAAARHVMATAVGLESQVLGEHEVLGQVRRARDRAARAGAAGPVLDRLVVDALRAGRRVRSTTPLGRGSVSVLSVGLQLVAGVCPGAGQRALVVGSSRTASAAGHRMRDFGWAVTQAADLPAPRSLGSFLRDFDVIVACTGASGHLIPAQALEEAAAHRGTPLVVLDLSMPRDVDPSARHIDGVLLFDVDALPAMAETAVASRRAGVADAKRIVDEELDRFGAWRADQILAPTIKALRNHVRDVLVDALDQSPGAEADAATVERIVGRILHTPTRRMREATADARGAESVRLLRWLFDVDGRGTP